MSYHSCINKVYQHACSMIGIFLFIFQAYNIVIYIVRVSMYIILHQWWLVQCWYFHHRPIPTKVWLQVVFSFVDLKSGTDVVSEAEAMSLEVMSILLVLYRDGTSQNQKKTTTIIFTWSHGAWTDKRERYRCWRFCLILLVYKSCCICMCICI